MFRHNPALAVLLLIASSAHVHAIWPFQPKEPSANKFEGLINVGPLGLENVTGTVAAFGDWNGDQS
jgi:hypothetical protein